MEVAEVEAAAVRFSRASRASGSECVGFSVRRPGCASAGPATARFSDVAANYAVLDDDFDSCAPENEKIETDE